MHRPSSRLSWCLLSTCCVRVISCWTLTAQPPEVSALLSAHSLARQDSGAPPAEEADSSPRSLHPSGSVRGRGEQQRAVLSYEGHGSSEPRSSGRGQDAAPSGGLSDHITLRSSSSRVSELVFQCLRNMLFRQNYSLEWFLRNARGSLWGPCEVIWKPWSSPALVLSVSLEERRCLRPHGDIVTECLPVCHCPSLCPRPSSPFLSQCTQLQ